jgi:hypothetical protein
MSDARHRRVDPPTVAAIGVLVPAMAAALFVAALEAGRARQPDDPLFDGPPPISMARAILDGDVEGAFAFVQAGRDPNLPVDATLADSSTGRERPVRVTPLVLAVAARDANNVSMLLSAGVDMTRPENQLALCLARERHDEALVTLLMRAVHGEPACPARARASTGLGSREAWSFVLGSQFLVRPGVPGPKSCGPRADIRLRSRAVHNGTKDQGPRTDLEPRTKHRGPRARGHGISAQNMDSGAARTRRAAAARARRAAGRPSRAPHDSGI